MPVNRTNSKIGSVFTCMSRSKLRLILEKKWHAFSMRWSNLIDAHIHYKCKLRDKPHWKGASMNDDNKHKYIIFKIFFTFIYVCIGHTRAVECMWRSEDNRWEFVLSFYHASLQNCSQSARLGSKHLYLLSHHTSIFCRGKYDLTLVSAKY